VPNPRKVEFLPLEALVSDPRNPKKHDEQTIETSIERFGMLDPIVKDDRTGYIISGHGRRDGLLAMWQRGVAAPEGVRVGPEGEWLVPVVSGWASKNDDEAAAALIALNRTTELGGWDDAVLLDLLEDVSRSSEGLSGVGFNDDSINDLKQLADLAEATLQENVYTRKIEAPVYEPTSDAPPKISELFDRARTEELQKHISEAELSDDVKEFLHVAAERHTRFHYRNIAEFYSHAPSQVQRLMEESALVIIDFDQALELGYVKLSEATAEDFKEADAQGYA